MSTAFAAESGYAPPLADPVTDPSRSSTRRLVADLVDGAIAGAVATWLMGRVTSALYERESKPARDREDAAREGKTAYGVAAEKVAEAVGSELDDDTRKRYGANIHWALGISAGAVYAVLRPRTEHASAAGGLVYGSTFWLAMDEIATPVLGLTKGPGAFPWQTHARGLAGHLTFGAVVDATLRVLQPAA